MRICPDCGHIDPGYWKHCRYSYYIDSCSYENLQLQEPELAKQMPKPGDSTEDKNYIYYRTRSGKNVMRKAKIDIGISRNPWGDGCETGKTNWKPGRSRLPKKSNICDFAKHWSKHSPNQKVLAEPKQEGKK